MSNTFEDFSFEAAIDKALAKQKYSTPTPIQADTIPLLLDGRDVLGCAQTGTGKTAAFALPILNKMAEFCPHPTAKSTRVLVLVPTRELAQQVGESFKTYGRYIDTSVSVIYGGVNSGKQQKSMASGVHVVVATPGRLLDLIKQGYITLESVRYFVLDEVDRMLDMGFQANIAEILEMLPPKRQNVFMSATLSPQVEFLAKEILSNPAIVKLSDAYLAAQNVDQRVAYLKSDNKMELLKGILRTPEMTKTLIFCRTKLATERVGNELKDAGFKAAIIHGDKFQRERQKVIKDFKENKVDILVATDVAARGLDIDNISHVINHNIPEEPEDYVHRIGRTARAGKKGVAFSLCSFPEKKHLNNIEKYIIQKIDVVRNHPFHEYEVEIAGQKREAKVKNRRDLKADSKKSKKDRTPLNLKKQGIRGGDKPGEEAPKKQKAKPRGRKAAVKARKKEEKNQEYIKKAKESKWKKKPRGD